MEYNDAMRKGKMIKVHTRVGSFDCLFESNAPDEGYTVTVPKLKGIVTFGKDKKEAAKMAQEAIELHCECLLQSGMAEVKIRSPKKAPKQRSRVFA